MVIIDSEVKQPETEQAKQEELRHGIVGEEVPLVPKGPLVPNGRQRPVKSARRSRPPKAVKKASKTPPVAKQVDPEHLAGAGKQIARAIFEDLKASTAVKLGNQLPQFLSIGLFTFLCSFRANVQPLSLFCSYSSGCKW